MFIPSDPRAVREALCALFDRLMVGPMPEDARESAQIVLAEALNNIVEHAYAQSPGEIEVTLVCSARSLTCSITDYGRPMPNAQLPEGRLNLPNEVDDLPEGGFGWYLIRSLSQDLDYKRVDGQNQLTFRIESKQCAK